MGRLYTAGAMVTLPRLGAVSAARLLRELITASKHEKKLPSLIVVARDALIPVYDSLEAELAKRVRGEESPQVRAADAVEDNAFGALVDWLRAIARLPAPRHPEALTAQSILHTVFGQGLEFLAIKPSNEWQEAEVRLKMLAEHGYNDAIEELGGKPFLDELAVAHKAYGEVLGITTPKVQSPAPALKQALSEARDELRSYVLVVSSTVKKHDPSSSELADRLLAPLREWHSTPSKPIKEEAEAPPVATPVPQAPISIPAPA